MVPASTQNKNLEALHMSTAIVHLAFAHDYWKIFAVTFINILTLISNFTVSLIPIGLWSLGWQYLSIIFKILAIHLIYHQTSSMSNV